MNGTIHESQLKALDCTKVSEAFTNKHQTIISNNYHTPKNWSYQADTKLKQPFPRAAIAITTHLTYKEF